MILKVRIKNDQLTLLLIPTHTSLKLDVILKITALAIIMLLSDESYTVKGYCYSK